jgi:hypothetical protein
MDEVHAHVARTQAEAAAAATPQDGSKQDGAKQDGTQIPES